MPSGNVLRRVLVKPTIYPATVAAATATNGIVIDRRGFEQAVVVLVLGTMVGAHTIDVKIQQGDLSNGSDQTDIPGAVFPQKANTASTMLWVGTLDLRKYKRYIRAVSTTAGTVTSSPISVFFILSDRNYTMLDTELDDASAPAFNV